jgi:2-haloacid dehalogenase
MISISAHHSPRYTHLLIDADGTLYDFDRSQAIALERTFSQFYLPFLPAYAGLYAQINERLWSSYEQSEIPQAGLVTSRFEQLFATLHIPQEPVEFNRQYLKNLAACNELLPGARQAVATLHGKVRMAILTNGLAQVQRARLTNSPISQYFDDLIISEEIGAAKPDPAVFEIAYQRLGKPPKEQLLMVGDSLTADIYGANQFGISSCWYNPFGAARIFGIHVDHEIRTLDELIMIVLAT